MAKELNPQDTTRATAYELWMKAPNPMVTFFKTFDVTNLNQAGRSLGHQQAEAWYMACRSASRWIRSSVMTIG